MQHTASKIRQQTEINNKMLEKPYVIHRVSKMHGKSSHRHTDRISVLDARLYTSMNGSQTRNKKLLELLLHVQQSSKNIQKCTKAAEL